MILGCTFFSTLNIADTEMFLTIDGILLAKCQGMEHKKLVLYIHEVRYIALVRRECWVSVILEEDIRLNIKMFQVLGEVGTLWHL